MVGVGSGGWCMAMMVMTETKVMVGDDDVVEGVGCAGVDWWCVVVVEKHSIL